ncbi:MAG: hypothetical protein EPN25_09295 [Nitrospirae bacterium]|nr:MAG: hypothetical protein EPN25_09295 [Nitrospirota bacterium]
MEENQNTDQSENNVPGDLTLVKVLRPSVEVYLSRSNRLFLQFTDYHEGLVEISRADLLELLNALDKNQRNKEQELLAELGDDEDDLL